jgi:hypothetical protein
MIEILLILIGNIWWALLGIIFVIFSKFSAIFLWQMTEGLFAMLLAVQFYLWTKSSTYKGKTRLWLLLGFLSGVMVMLRFAGFSVLGWWFVVGFVLWTRSRATLRDLFAYLSGALSIIIPWVVYTRVIKAEAVSRMLYFHPPEIPKFYEFANTILCWFSGSNILTALIFLIIGLGILITVKIEKENLATIFKDGYYFVLFSIYYFVFIIISFTLFDAHIQFDNRIFSPIFITLFLLLIVILRNWHNQMVAISHTRINMKKILYILFFIGFCSQLYSGIGQYYSFHKEGLGYSHKEIRGSESIRAINEMETVKVLTNFPQMLKIHVQQEKQVKGTPIKISTNNGTVNLTYDKEVEDMLMEVEKGVAVLLLFKESSRDFYFCYSDIVALDNRVKGSRLHVRYFDDAALVYRKD